MATDPGFGAATGLTGRVVVTGAAGVLGARVCELAAGDPAVVAVVALDRRDLRGAVEAARRAERPDAPDVVAPHRVDLASADLKPLFEGATAVIHLAQSVAPGRARGHAGDATHSGDVEIARRVLDAAAATAVPTLVVLSSATVYGAWSNNAVPLTEDAPLRPNPGATYAIEKAEVERLAVEWRDDHPGTSLAVLRPTVTVAPDRNGWLARALDRSGRVPLTDDEPPAQFLDVDDLARAIDLARHQRLDGAYNVAPDAWISGDTARALAGGGPRLRVPERVAATIARTGWRWGLASTPPELLPYTVHPWVVANDRLRAAGWAPASTNEEAYVAAHRGGPLATMSPRRRQELLLGVAGTGLAGLAAGAVALLRRRARRA